MAPYTSFILDNLHHQTQMENRDLGKNTSGIASVPTIEEAYALQVLALTFSAISVASSLLAFYWFVKMRRSFRHDLIMLLIQSDMFKALWFMLYPIVVFSQGPVSSGSRFCQINGFFISVGIEASDFAVLQIAVHTALYIFKPRSRYGEGGLYPYRYIAYFCWLFFPLLMASLAFVNDRDAYVVDGTYCYTPVRPFWYRLALAWIPRYIIFIVILFIYASIYYYVRYKFHGFTKIGEDQYNANPDSVDSADAPNWALKRHTLPPTPPLACHGLAPMSSHMSMSEAPLQDLATTIDSYSLADTESRKRGVPHVHRFMWQSFVAKSTPSDIIAPTSNSDLIISPEPSTSQVASIPDPQWKHPPTGISSPLDHSSLNVADPISLRSQDSWTDTFAHRYSPFISGRSSTVNMVSVLRRGPGGSSNALTPVSQLQLLNSRGQTLIDAEMERSRDKIRRQLRFLFIYPLVYVGMWMLPFVSHVLQYNDRFAANPPFGLTCIATIFLCSQAAVDCWLFSTREKPWRHMPGLDGTFWGSFRLGQSWNSTWRSSNGGAAPPNGPGKTREEMNREARDAYQRRDEELAQRKHDSNIIQRPELAARLVPQRESHWWDRPDLDGAVDMGNLSPVFEESIPIDSDQISEQISEKSTDDGGRLEKAKLGASGFNTTGEVSPSFETTSFEDDYDVMNASHKEK